MPFTPFKKHVCPMVGASSDPTPSTPPTNPTHKHTIFHAHATRPPAPAGVQLLADPQAEERGVHNHRWAALLQQHRCFFACAPAANASSLAIHQAFGWHRPAWPPIVHGRGHSWAPHQPDSSPSSVSVSVFLCG